MHITEKQFARILALVEALGPRVRKVVMEGERVTLELGTGYAYPYYQTPNWGVLHRSTTTNPGTITVHADGSTTDSE